MKIDYIASPTLSLFHQDNTFIRGIRGPYGSGKSVAMCMELLMRAMAMPKGPDGKRRSKWAVIRNTYTELKDSTLKTWLEWVPQDKFGVYHQTDKTHYVRFGDVELDVVFRALDKPEDVRKLLSVEYTAGWINEAREVPKAILEALIARVSRFPKPDSIPGGYWSGVIMDTNPPDNDHWWFQIAEEPEKYVRLSNPTISDDELAEQVAQIRNTYRFYSQPSALSDQAENLAHLAKDQNGNCIYYKRMMVGKTPEWIKVYIHGQYGFIVDGKPVYTNYIDDVHCPKNTEVRPISGVEIIRGWDFGLTPACIFLQVTSRGQVIVFDELVSEDMGIDRFSDQVMQHSKQKYGSYRFVDYGDPAGTQRSQTDEKTCFQILMAKGVEIEPGKQDLVMRHESVRKALNSMVDGRPGFLLHPRCSVLRKGFMGGYQYKRMAVSGFDRYQERPDKNRFSHPHDALQYAMTMITGLGLVDPFDKESADDYDGYEPAKEYAGRSAITGY